MHFRSGSVTACLMLALCGIAPAKSQMMTQSDAVEAVKKNNAIHDSSLRMSSIRSWLLTPNQQWMILVPESDPSVLFFVNVQRKASCVVHFAPSADEFPRALGSYRKSVLLPNDIGPRLENLVVQGLTVNADACYLRIAQCNELIAIAFSIAPKAGVSAVSVLRLNAQALPALISVKDGVRDLDLVEERLCMPVSLGAISIVKASASRVVFQDSELNYKWILWDDKCHTLMPLAPPDVIAKRLASAGLEGVIKVSNYQEIADGIISNFGGIPNETLQIDLGSIAVAEGVALATCQ